jgi:hypothetical protein
MLGRHLMWENPRVDAFTSFTNSILFALVHAIRRYEIGQREVFVAGGKTSKLRTQPSDNGEDEPAFLYSANRLHESLDLKDHHFGLFAGGRLDTRLFTHEFLSYGVLLDPERAILHSPFEDLVRNGLLHLFPELEIKDLHYRRVGLFGCLVTLRTKLFIKATAKGITAQELRLCERLARLFTNPTDSKASFHAFVSFLSLRKRRLPDPNFSVYLKATYTGKSTTSCCSNRN